MYITASYSVVVCCLIIAGCTTRHQPEGASLPAPLGIVSGTPSPVEIVARMKQSFASSPVLHVTVLNRHHGVDYECQGWMMGVKALSEVTNQK